MFKTRFVLAGGLVTLAALASSVSGQTCPDAYRPASAVFAEDPEAAAIKQTRRYLRLKNDTGDTLTVFVQYHTWTKKGVWQWFPSPPDGGEAVAYTLAPGEQADLRHEDWPLSACKIRLWGRTDGGLEFDDFKDQDLWLVEENAGERAYYAPQAETFTFTFLPPTPEMPGYPYEI